ncbi:thymic stromal lymphopoietin, partial [Cynocephalus volans]|uniref:thymic stromal lymphopoietin n=1 Tax=Cynocephalus volans TaxID=110931 RepID=UPI002FC5B60D
FPTALPNALLFVLSVFFRKILILQLVGLVLTYNFSNCDFNKIRVEYDQIIFSDLKKYMNGTKSTQFNYNISCNNPPDCLTEIQRVTFSPTHGCTSLHKEMFAVKTKATLTLQCPGYSGIQINNTQAKKNRKKREVTTNKCLKQASQLLGLWRRFSRIKGNKRNHLNYSHILKHQRGIFIHSSSPSNQFPPPNLDKYPKTWEEDKPWQQVRASMLIIEDNGKGHLKFLPPEDFDSHLDHETNIVLGMATSILQPQGEDITLTSPHLQAQGEDITSNNGRVESWKASGSVMTLLSK